MERTLAQLTSVRNPVWADAEHTMIDCEITNTVYGDEVLPFTACANDVEAHGQRIFSDLVAGVYGPIAEYVAPPKVTATPPSGSIPVEVL